MGKVFCFMGETETIPDFESNHYLIRYFIVVWFNLGFPYLKKDGHINLDY